MAIRSLQLCGGVVGILAASAAHAQAPAAISGEQQEADYRVIAARCGTPAFERVFVAQSRRLVAAGAVAPGRDPKAVEKTITELRRNPLVLVAGWSDCPAERIALEKLQKSRAALAAKKPVSR